MWTDFIANSIKWTSVFGEKYTPRNLRISYAIFKDDSITLKLNSPIEPGKCPGKWIQKGYDEFDFDLLLDHINSITIRHFIFYGPIELSIEQTLTSYEVHMKALGHCVISCTVRGAFVSNINAFHNDQSV